jgi:CRP-like cAMP-binding protein
VFSHVEEALASSPMFRGLTAEDRRRLAGVSAVRVYEKGDLVFSEGDPSDHIFTILSGRVKVAKIVAPGREVILEIFGPGDPLGAIVAYEGRPFPASAIAIERSLCLAVRRAAFFELMERHPTLVRGYLVGMAHRILELTRRIPEVSGGRVEARFAHLFLKFSDKMGKPTADGVFIPFPLSRQELSEMAGTTLETTIRLMSRWGKEGVVRTEKDGFVLENRAELERLLR